MEEVLVVIIVFGSALGALYLVLDFLQSKRSSPGSVAAGQSLTTTELSELIDESVAKSVKRIEKRIENLEAIVVDQPVTAPVDSARLSVPDEDEYVSGGRDKERQKTH